MHNSSSDNIFCEFWTVNVCTCADIAELLVDDVDDLYVSIILALASMVLIEEVENGIDNGDNKHFNPLLLMHVKESQHV